MRFNDLNPSETSKAMYEDNPQFADYVCSPDNATWRRTIRREPWC